MYFYTLVLKIFLTNQIIFNALNSIYTARINMNNLLINPLKPPISIPIFSPQPGHIDVLILISYPHSLHLVTSIAV